MRHVIFFLLFFFAASASFAAIGEQDLFGLWRSEEAGYRTNLEFKKEGQFSGNSSRQGKTIWEFAGTWELRDGIVFYTYTKSSSAKIKNGYQEQDRVVAVTRDFVVLESTKDGKKIRYEKIP